MKRLLVLVGFLNVVFCMDNSNIPRADSLSSLYKQRMDAPTSPLKPVRVRKRKLEATGYTDTERESEIDAKIDYVPFIRTIRNQFKYPILVVLPMEISAKDRVHPLGPNKNLELSSVKLTGPGHRITISVNNKIHELHYDEYLFDIIDRAVQVDFSSIKAKNVEIIIDDRGELLIKPLKQEKSTN